MNTAQSFQFTAISQMGDGEFMSASDPAEAIDRLRRRLGEALLRRTIGTHGGYRFDVYRVDLPVGDGFPIENGAPENGVPFEFQASYKFITYRGRYVEIPRSDV